MKIKIINFRGDLTDSSAEKEALVVTSAHNSDYSQRLDRHITIASSVAVLADTSVRSPRNLMFLM